MRDTVVTGRTTSPSVQLAMARVSVVVITDKRDGNCHAEQRYQPVRLKLASTRQALVPVRGPGVSTDSAPLSRVTC
jgi:hypothetical protein